VNCAARIEALGAGGQVLLSADTFALLEDRESLVFKQLGHFPLKGMTAEQEIVQASVEELDSREFPAITAKKAETVTRHGPQTCDECSRPLKCDRCSKAAKKTGPGDGRHFSVASSISKVFTSSPRTARGAAHHA
jgi:hypothetical protein